MMYRTGGFLRPLSMEADSTSRLALSGWGERSGVKPTSRISQKATPNIARSTPTRNRNGTPRSVAWAITPPAVEPASIAMPETINARPNTASNSPS
ncbi:hypothetical protein AHiyo4_22340 [Arthrobacter sp. Hiyo4]|nr:hypothetical protein AHiyo4_22340 [Arthrobacter sp. Hiyo4]